MAALQQHATGFVFENLVDASLAEVGHGGTDGVTTIHDIDGLARFLDLDPERLRSDPWSFETGEELVVPWPITEPC
jgi:hypothetical protein